MQGAVIGAGVAGIAMAHALRSLGIAVDLIEQSSEPRSTGYQLNVLANGKYALAQIGLLDALERSGYGGAVRTVSSIDGLTGAVIRRIPVSGRGAYVPTSFHRGDLHKALLRGLTGAPPECGREVESVADDAGREKVQVRFVGGELREFDFVIAADGAHSKIRRQLFPTHRGYVPSFDALLFAVQLDLDADGEAERLFAEQLRQGDFPQINAPGTVIVLSPAGGGRFGVIIGIDDRHRDQRVANTEDAKALARALVRDVKDARVHRAIDAGFWEAGNPLVWHIGDIDPLPRFHVGRIALTGDAAHAMLPMLGQGANQAFEDAMVLARELRSTAVAPANLPGAIVQAFERYSAERQPHVARVQQRVRRIGRATIAKTRMGHHLGLIVARWYPQWLLDRYERHILRYASADPAWPC